MATSLFRSALKGGLPLPNSYLRKTIRTSFNLKKMCIHTSSVFNGNMVVYLYNEMNKVFKINHKMYV